MKLVRDIDAIRRLQAPQRGVFTTADLATVLGEKHPAGFVRRVNALEREGVLARFVRGWYLVPGVVDLPTLSQRIAADSYVSFGTVLATTLVVGPSPEHEIWAAKIGRSRDYVGAGYRVVHLGIQPELFFGFTTDGGRRTATPEKALLDVLYFHLRGRKYPFDIFSDLTLDSINRGRVLEYLQRYRNPKFAAFVKGLLDAAR